MLAAIFILTTSDIAAVTIGVCYRSPALAIATGLGVAALEVALLVGGVL